DAEAFFHFDRRKADVVRLLEHRDDAAAVEADIEFPRQPKQRALVETVEVPLARIRPCVDELLRIDAGSGGAGDVADIISAGAARAQAEVLHRLDHAHRALRLDLAYLQVRARRHMRVAAAVFLGEIGDAGELPVLEDAV